MCANNSIRIIEVLFNVFLMFRTSNEKNSLYSLSIYLPLKAFCLSKAILVPERELILKLIKNPEITSQYSLGGIKNSRLLINAMKSKRQFISFLETKYLTFPHLNTMEFTRSYTKKPKVGL